MALRFQKACVGVAAVRSERVWSEAALKEQNKGHGQKQSTSISISSVLICLNCLPSSVVFCVAQSR